MNTNVVQKIEKALEKADIKYTRKYAETGTIYIEGQHDDVFFKIRVSDHFVLYPCSFKIFIDTFEDKVTPRQIVEEIKKGRESKYYVGREWVEEVERQNRMWEDMYKDEREKNREINQRRYEEYLKLWEDEELVKKIQALKNRQEIRAFAKEHNLKVHNVFCVWKGIKTIKKFLTTNISK